VGVGGVAGNTDVDMVGEGVMDDDGTSTVSGALKGVSASRGSVCREDGGSTMVDDSVEVSRFEGGGYSSANLTIFLLGRGRSSTRYCGISFDVFVKLKANFLLGRIVFRHSCVEELCLEGYC
jgi:hypothetical protein